MVVVAFVSHQDFAHLFRQQNQHYTRNKTEDDASARYVQALMDTARANPGADWKYKDNTDLFED